MRRPPKRRVPAAWRRIALYARGRADAAGGERTLMGLRWQVLAARAWLEGVTAEWAGFERVLAERAGDA